MTAAEIRDVRAYGRGADLVRYRTDHAYRATVRRVVGLNFYLLHGSYPTWLSV